jgi:hypothetical protein
VRRTQQESCEVEERANRVKAPKMGSRVRFGMAELSGGSSNREATATGGRSYVRVDADALTLLIASRSSDKGAPGTYLPFPVGPSRYNNAARSRTTVLKTQDSKRLK